MWDIKREGVREQERIISTALSQKYAALWLLPMCGGQIRCRSGVVSLRGGGDFGKQDGAERQLLAAAAAGEIKGLIIQ